MPSIRLRSSAYSSLRDEPPSEPPLTLANLFTATAHPIGTRRSLPSLPGQDPIPVEVPPPLPIGRPRSGTTTSRIHAAINRSSRRYPRAASHNESGSSIIPITSPVSVRVESGSPIDPRQTNSSLASLQNDTDESFESDLHHDDVIEHLDVIDPEIATASNLTNAANSIIFPPTPWYPRRPVVVLSSTTSSTRPDIERRPSQYDHSLDEHVDDVLRRPSKIRRTLQGIWAYLKTPMGIITAIYGFLVAFWGAAIVLFVAKIINLHNPDKQGFWVEVSSQIENGLFTITGIGLIPFRVMDTYRICRIWYYKRKTRKLREKAGIPQLLDEDDLPNPLYDPNYVHVLTEKEEKNLHRQQHKFQHSQTWYRPHGTETHRAFPITTALLICLFVDGNSIFQIMLCGCMWGLNRFQRPAWTTGTLIPCSFLCGIIAAGLIWWGGQKTKRVAEVEERLRAALAAEKENNERAQEPGDKQASSSEEKETEVDQHTTFSPQARSLSPLSYPNK